MSQHKDLEFSRWSGISFDPQILMIANEMHRASKLQDAAAGDRRRRAYERALALTDLTIRLPARPGRRRELLRCRDLPAALYVAPEPDPVAHRAALRVLLRFTPTASRQIPHVDC